VDCLTPPQEIKKTKKLIFIFGLDPEIEASFSNGPFQVCMYKIPHCLKTDTESLSKTFLLEKSKR
jgi:hypothetical protein